MEISMLLNERQETSNYDMSGECDSGMKMIHTDALVRIYVMGI